MRTFTSPIAATLQIALVAIGVPVALTIRLTDPLLPLQNVDAALAVGIVVWLVVAKALIDRGDAIDSRVVNRLSPMWQIHRLVDQSIFGVGYSSHKIEAAGDAGLSLLTTPGVITPDQLPDMPEAAEPQIGRGDTDSEEAGPRKSIPVLPTDEHVAPPILETFEYTVARGDTFWSIAEAVLNDGRLWTTLQEINFGREVAPGVLLDEDDDLRIGWSILLPVIEQQDAETDES